MMECKEKSEDGNALQKIKRKKKTNRNKMWPVPDV